MIGTVMLIDSAIAKNLIGFSRITLMIFIRFFPGFLTTYYLPALITKIFGVEKTIRQGLPTRRTQDTISKAIN